MGSLNHREPVSPSDTDNLRLPEGTMLWDPINIISRIELHLSVFLHVYTYLKPMPAFRHLSVFTREFPFIGQIQVDTPESESTDNRDQTRLEIVLSSPKA